MKLRYYFKNYFFELVKEIIFHLLRYLSEGYQTEEDGTTIFTLGKMTGIDVETLEQIISDLIIEGKIYEADCYKYRIY
ncbi:MAG: hypothetical protein ACFFBP_06815 [Promethearchaeota archaeon]